MKKKYNFKDLFVLDLANNHQGDIDHALNIVRSIGKIVADQNILAGLKVFEYLHILPGYNHFYLHIQ